MAESQKCPNKRGEIEFVRLKGVIPGSVKAGARRPLGQQTPASKEARNDLADGL